MGVGQNSATLPRHQASQTHSCAPLWSYPAMSNATPNGRLCSNTKTKQPEMVSKPQLARRTTPPQTQGPHTHHLLLVAVLSEAERQVANGLGQRLQADGLVVGEPVVLGLHARMVDERPGVRHQTTHGRANVRVHLQNLLNAVRVFRRRQPHFSSTTVSLHAHRTNTQSRHCNPHLLGSSSVDVRRFSTARMTASAVWMPTAVEPSCPEAKQQANQNHSRSTDPSNTLLRCYLHSLDGVLHLEQPALRREGVDSSVVFAPAPVPKQQLRVIRPRCTRIRCLIRRMCTL